MSASYPTKLILAFRSGDVCALPDCGKELTAAGEQSGCAVIGEAAHISGEHPSAARYDSAMTDDQRDHCDNLIYVCGGCHNRIDKQVADFPPERLRDIKRAHETKVREAMADAFSKVGFPELEEATRWILRIQPDEVKGDFSLIAPEDKLTKNGLHNDARIIIAMGLSVAREVRAFVESVSQMDSSFPDRLKCGFLAEYYRLRQEGHLGEGLFDLMCSFAQRGFGSQAQRSAGLAVLIYLFESCEVFEI